ncbi:MAG: UvrD-helicase domain-containing protein [Candidatus Izemoplasmatales bacterium]|jgi:DNA helicase-2/ATP-dependent DNA helicase PcrA|nr:UvrD-helicase domain-containing protein [Candidatus Izemoplasmatales bacterium]
MIFDQLNEKQLEAVKVVNGPVMAVAGAGSGKTRVLTRRIAYLIEEQGVPANSILAITFTNRAAEEMRHRVFQLVNIPVKGIWISTFHAMGAKILRNDIHHLGYKNDFQIIDDDDSQIITKNILKDLNYDTKKFSPRSFYSMIEDAKADPMVLELYREPVKSVLNQVYHEYVSYLKKNNLVDFQDLLVLMIQLFRQEPHILRKYQDWFQYILVDEFQDTNDLQYEIVYLLAMNHHNLFIVGDEDQSIYAFRGSNIQNIRKFMKDFPEYKTIILNQNYRSVSNILKAANSVIKMNRSRIPKELFSTLGEGEKVVHFKAETDEEEAYFIYTKIKSLNKEGISFKDMAIFYRNNAMSRRFEDILLKYNIPYKVIGNTSFYKRKEIKDIISYLHLLVNLGDDYAFERVYNEPKRGVGDVSFKKMKDFATLSNLRLMDIIDESASFLSKLAFSRMMKFKSDMIEIQKNIENQNLLVTYDQILDKSGYMAMLKDYEANSEKRFESERRIENLEEFKTILLEKIKDYDTDVSNYEKLIGVLEELALREETEDLLEQNEYVSLMTVHSAKGLEFNVVFVSCLEQTLFPSSQSLFEKADVEEERRLFYVALTRAKELAFLTNARTRYMYGRFMENLDSQFLGELDESVLDKIGLSKPKNIKMEKPKYNPEPIVNPFVKETYERVEQNLVIGDKVRHKVFGDGVVVAIQDDKATIAFQKDVGIKRLMKDHPSIEKVR